EWPKGEIYKDGSRPFSFSHTRGGPRPREELAWLLAAAGAWDLHRLVRGRPNPGWQLLGCSG
ncbi:hypothetical protein TorRG33x02_005420, partial [Trema orientale]